ncbi:MAG: CHAT domain-containing protein [candidate division KSB1 bacterium]|nr:CHAT domain-containing protein [candidate division KSB1 bacterium]MDZ7305059.1 CHAT domain-containing protein [candidate division KSB1 bacterium]MDZ7313826.1 CHAT domain-containing protein [candidate division KSB1 bacterium]
MMPYPYPSTEQFIDRQREIDQVEEALSQITSRKPPAIRGILYFGIPGIGKSRILLYIHKLCHQQKLFTLLVDFQNPAIHSHFEYLLHLSDQIEPLPLRDHLLGATGDSGNSIKRAEQALPVFARNLKQHLKKRPLILLMDSCELCAPDFFDWIGEQVLVQLMNFQIGPIGLFLASRGPQVAESKWPVEMIRATRFERIFAFDFEATQQHIAAIDQDPPRCRGGEKDIYELSAGHPLSTEAVVDFLRTLNVDIADFPQHRSQLARRLYHEVIHRYLCAGVTTWEPAIFDVACIPRRFDPILLEKIAPEHNYHRYAAGLRDLQKPEINLIEVDSVKPGYRLESTLRRLLHTAVSILYPARVLELNQKLKDFYEAELAHGALSERPTAAALLELLYHRIQIEILSNRPPLSAAEDLLEAKLQAHFHPEQRDDQLELVHLQDLLTRDLEFREILGKGAVDRLALVIDRFTRVPRREPSLSHLIILHTPPSAYHVSCYTGNTPVLPTQRIHTRAKYPIQQWRANPKEIGTVAFNAYLNPQAQEFVRKAKKHAILLTTDTMDIPFELLYDGREFLCLRQPFSRRIEMLATPKKFEVEKPRGHRALVIGNPTGDLPYTAQEAHAVAEVLKKSDVHVDCFIGPEQATLNEIVKQLNLHGYHLIHFAGHGSFHKRYPTLSGLRFSEGMLSADELKRYLQAPAFVFFSACWAAAAKKETTRSNFQGKFIENLAIAALEGGACGCLGPMWEIEDRTAKDFALTFYTQLLLGSRIGEAVLQARRRVRRRKTDCWASWVLFGDPFIDPFHPGTEHIKF